jgi:hypothetical protein
MILDLYPLNFDSDPYLCVVIHIGVVLKGGDFEGGRRRGVRMGKVALEGSMRGGRADVAIFLDDELALGKCPLQEGIVGRRTLREDVV